MKVCLLCRVSTNHQDYHRQIAELTEYCNRLGWSIERVFANKVSGAKTNDERPEIASLIEYVQTNKVDKVVCLEISRLGRNTLEALKVIQVLNEQGICLCATRCTSIYKGLATFHITCLWHCGMRHRGGRTVIQACWRNVGSRRRNVKGNAESDEQGRNVPKSSSVADCPVVALKCL